jgi:hypothetical protein
LPVKASFIPIIMRKMEYRFQSGEVMSSVAKEAEALEAWIKTKVNGHQIPSAVHIENEVRARYRRLKTASTASI